MSVPLTLACERYDRTEALRDGRVRVAGAELTYLAQTVEETFFRMARFHEFDAAEMSLASYTVSLSRGAPFIAIPVFPSRFFRHSGIYVSAQSDIREPADLVGKRVGIAEYQLTANVWIRGMLDEHYGVPVESVRYHVGGLHEAGRIEKLALELPAEIRLASIPADRTLNEMLAAGELDAVYTPRMPHAYADGSGLVRRLFDPSQTAEAEYFRQTGIFPIMHVVVLRRDVYEQNRWLARSLTEAFAAAKQLAAENFRETATLRTMLPWLLDEVERTTALMGPDYWPYGLERNEPTLDTFLQYAHRQGLTPERLHPRELFAPETLEHTRV